MESTLDPTSFLAERKELSARRLEELTRRLRVCPVVNKQRRLCIYVCGSYGRLEASSTSDLDLFLVNNDLRTKVSVSRLDEILVRAEIIKTARDMQFPEFSNDGEYLQTHSLNSILTELGGRVDDYQNYFTARLLLLLESRPIHGDKTYSLILHKIIEAYYRDYHDHEVNFRPIFLLNDITRFWKTLCLNYEHRRNRKQKDPIKKSKHHLRNLKLKFSRMLICFSMAIPLAVRPSTSPEDVLGLVRLTPFERLETVARTESEQQKIRDLRQAYVWFLREIEDPDAILTRLTDREYRDDIFGRGREFTKLVYGLLSECVPSSDALRYMVL